MKRTIVLVFVLAFVALLFALPAYAGWQASGLQGKDITSLAEDPTTTTTWYAGTAYGEIYKSTNGSTWSLSNNGIPAGAGILSFSIDPANTAIVYAGLNGAGVYKSSDGGNTWSAIGPGSFSVRSIEIDPYNSSILFAATDNGIYKSTDAGTNWQAITSAAIDSSDMRKVILNPPDFTLNPLPSQTDIVYAAATGGLYKSTDAGSTWSKINTGLSSTNFTTIAVDPKKPANVYAGTSDNGIYKSVDSGSTWTAINNGLGNQNILAITFYPYASTGVLAGTATGGIYRTDTSGNNWYAWNDGNTAAKANTVSFLSPQYAVILSGTSDGVIKFDNSLPDLVVTTVSGPPSAGTAQQISATVVVKNQGGGSIPAGPYIYVGLHLSSDAVITSSDTLIGQVAIGSGLAAGAETTVTVIGTVPYNISGGPYYLGAIADDPAVTGGNYVVESDENNNARAGNQITIIPPDLIITSVSSPPSASTGQQISVPVTVKNQGGGSIPAGPFIYVGVHLSSDAVITSSDTLIGQVAIGSGLAAGEEKTVTITWTVPGNYNGTYYLGAIADDPAVTGGGNYIVESDENNNASAGNQIVINPPRPDLIITSVSGPASGGTAQQISVPVTIKNQGTENVGGGAYVYVSLYLSSDATISGSDTKIGEAYAINLATGEEKTVAVTGTIPYNISGGPYYLGAMVDIYNYVVESNENNNASAGSPITVNPPDLVITSVSGPPSAGTAQQISATVVVKNQGGGSIPAGPYIYVGLHLSSDAVITSSDTLIGQVAIGSGLAAGEEKTVTVTGTIPYNISGPYYLGAIADDPAVTGGNYVVESDENNNARAGNQITIIPPDLIITSVSSPPSASTGQQISVPVTVKNQGDGNVPAVYVYVSLYLSSDATITESDTLIGRATVTGLAAGEEKTITITWTVPSGYNGIYYLGAIADDVHYIVESNENNNASSGNPITIGLPDLIVTSVSGPTTGTTSQTITVTNAVKNQGLLDAGGFYAAIYLSTDATITTTDFLIGYRWVSGLAAGAMEDTAVDTPATIPAGLAPGTYHIGAIVDPNNFMSESNENNNALAGNQIEVTNP